MLPGPVVRLGTHASGLSASPSLPERRGRSLRAPALAEVVLGSQLAKADDAGVRVLDKDTPDGSPRGYMWGLLGDGKWARYRFTNTKTWASDEMATFLGARTGSLQGDGYEQLYRKACP